MPKASFAKKDAVEVSLGIQEGFIEVIGAVTKIHQYPVSRKTGEQSGPFACVQIEVLRLDEKGERLADGESIFHEFTVGGGDRNNPGVFKFRPGKAASADDDDPEDLGSDVDTEGNCLFCDEGAKLNKKSKWILFTDSLEEKGFKPEVLANGYMPDLVGLKAHVHTISLPKLPGSTSEKENTALVADKILSFPYDKKGGAAKKSAAKPGAAEKAEKPAAKAAAKATPAPAASHADTGDDPEQIALMKLFALTTDPEFSGKEGIDRKKIQTTVQTKLMREKVNTKLHKPVMELIKSDEWLTAKTTEDEDSPIFGKMSFDFDESTVTFIED